MTLKSKGRTTMDNVQDGVNNENRKITRAKRIIGRMETTEELRAIQKYISERWEIINRRGRDAKIQARWEKIATLPMGAEIAVNAHGYRQFPGGSILVIDSFSTRGRKCVYLKTENGKRYSFNRKALDDYDIQPAAEIDLTKMWDKGVMAF
jgi:hypothetical protein